MTSGTDVGAGEEPTRVAQRTKSNVELSSESVVITAEIPLVGPSRPRRIGVANEGWYEQPERRAPAPIAIQLVVWFLFVLFLVGLGGLLVEHFHPIWLDFLRNKPTQSAPGRHAVGTPSSATTGSRPSSPSAFALTSSNAGGATYSVPSTSSYELVVAVANPCYIAVTAPPKSKHYVYAHTITPADSPAKIQVSGPSSLMLGARATSIIVEVNAKHVGTISPPKSSFTYTFVPSAQ